MSTLWEIVKLLVCSWILLLMLLSAMHRLACLFEDWQKERARKRRPTTAIQAGTPQTSP